MEIGMETDAPDVAQGSAADSGALGLVEPPLLAWSSGLRGLGDDSEAVLDTADRVVPDQLIPSEPEPAQSRPYAAQTLDKVRELAPHIHFYADRYNVPPLAVAGAIANEYDTRFDHTRKGLLHYDQFQDWYVPKLSWPGSAITERFDNRVIPAYAGSPGWLDSDIGPANIHLATAMQLWHDYPEDFPSTVHDYPSLAKYVVSNEGTAQLASRYISWAQRAFDNSLSNTEKPLSPDDRVALYVDYFRKGPLTVGQQWTGRLESKYGPGANLLVSGTVPLAAEDLPHPYDGVRAVVNKRDLLRALGQ
jgi:hypothetical protein